MLAWCGGAFDPARADLSALQTALDRLARRWSPRSRPAAKARG